MKILVLLFAFFSVEVMAQSNFVSGYIITNKNDTVKGEIKVNTKNEMEVYSKVSFREKNPGGVRSYLPSKIRGFSYDDAQFASVRNSNQWVFMQILCNGKIMVFEYKPPVALGNDRMQSQYFLMRGGFEDMVQVFMDGKIKKQIKPYIYDDKPLLKEIDTQNLDYSSFLQVINKFNSRNK
jgi:hypothetical protein